jgi:hypothetical protein
MNQPILLATFGVSTCWLTSLTLALHITKCDRENLKLKLPEKQIEKLFYQRSYFYNQYFKIVTPLR